jgi:hypothetical protein
MATPAGFTISGGFSAAPALRKGLSDLCSCRNDPQSIIEYRLSPGASSVKSPKPDPDSQLCAYYNTRERKRYCIYQLDGILHYFEGQGSGST